MDRIPEIVSDGIRPQFPPKCKKNNATSGSKKMHLHLSRSKMHSSPRTEIRRKETKRGESDKMVVKDIHLALKVLHYIQKVVVHVRFIMELHLDRVQVAQRVRHIQRPIIVAAVALSRVGSRSGRSSVAAAILYRYRVRLDRRCARAGMHGRAGERVVRTQPGRWWWGLRRRH
jgi:hypothetical protein